MQDEAPIDDETFAALMAPLGPFEQAPLLAVGVSGGADSLAIALLAARWAEARGGRAVALTVDHRLRPESAAEAAEAGAILNRWGIEQQILPWLSEKPSSGVQEAARAARYRLMEAWCAQADVLHLLLAHHREDQAETLLLRLGQGSGAFGLAGMAAVTEREQVRVLRPLLSVASSRLRATVARSGERWLHDPSNDSAAFGRVRMRRLAPALAAEGLSAEVLATTARRLSRARVATETALAGLLAAAVSLRPEGYARIDSARFLAAPAELRLRLLAAVTACVGGREWPPRMERVERMDGRMRAAESRQRTLGGCLIRPIKSGWLVCREPDAPERIPLAAGEDALWDGRFFVTMAAGAKGPVEIGPLGIEGRRRLAAGLPSAASALPSTVLASLPALRDGSGNLSLPHFSGWRESLDSAGFPPATAEFRPARALLTPGFWLV